MVLRAAWSLTYATSVASSTGSQVNARENLTTPALSGRIGRAHSQVLSSKAPMSNHGPVRARRYHAASVLKYISGIIVPVNKSTIGYFKSVIRVSLRLPVIAVLPKSYLDGPTPNHLALHQKQPRMAESLHAGCIYACSYSGA